MDPRFEELRRKYRMAKREEDSVDLPSLKSEIEFYIRTLQTLDEKDEDLAAEVQDMLIDLTKIVEESHCHPFKPKKT